MPVKNFTRTFVTVTAFVPIQSKFSTTNAVPKQNSKRQRRRYCNFYRIL